MDSYSKYLVKEYTDKLIEFNSLFFVFTTNHNYFNYNLDEINENGKYKIYKDLDDILYTDGWSPYKNILGMYAILEANGTIRFVFSCDDVKNIKNINKLRKRLMLYVEYCIISMWKNISIEINWYNDLLCIDIKKTNKNISIETNIDTVQYIIDDFAIGDPNNGFGTIWKQHWNILNADNLFNIVNLFADRCGLSF